MGDLENSATFEIDKLIREAYPATQPRIQHA